MHDLRTAVVGTVCLAVGVLAAWFIFGAKAAHLEQENRALREQRRGQFTAAELSPPLLRRQLVGHWATTVSESRQGRTELIFELGEDGSVRWRSVQKQEFTTIAEGTWELLDDNIRFDVTVTDRRSRDVGKQKSAQARILDVSESCLTLELEGVNWAFHRTTT